MIHTTGQNIYQKIKIMKKLLLALIAICSIGAAQLPETGDSIYYSPKFCDSAVTIEDALTSWAFSANVSDCFNPSIEMLNALWPNLTVKDTYDCCCKVASSPGMPSSWNGFPGSVCESYLDSLGWSGFEDNLGINKDMINQGNGIYFDMFGRQYLTQPKGFSIMDGESYYKFN